VTPEPYSCILGNLNAEVETQFDFHFQRKRDQLANHIRFKMPNDYVVKPYSKVFKGDEVRNFRGSKFRGISKNGNSWQILVMINRQKKYLGTLPSEEQAARFYDRVSIQYQGLKAKTNFAYTAAQVDQILKMAPLA